ncbi:MAG: PTS sugar transporter subunit IIA [Sphingomonadaceae bacterium]
MNPNFKIVPEAVVIGKVDSRAAALERLAHIFSGAYGLSYDLVLERLEEREALGSTGFVRGVAIPHARVPEVKRPSVAVLRPLQPVEFDSADGMPVTLVFGLLSPDNAGVTHLHALAAISRLVRDDTIREALQMAPDEAALFALINNATDRDAA